MIKKSITKTTMITLNTYGHG